MTAPSRFLHQTLACFDRAGEQAGLTEQVISVGGVAVRLRVAGPGVADALFEGLAAAPAEQEPQVVLSAFDTATGGEVPPAPPWSVHDYRPRDEVADFAEGRWRAAYSLNRATLWFPDTATGRGVGWLRDAAGLSAWERERPWRVALHWALPPFGVHIVHAAAVGEVLVAGPPGAGKSTTALAAAAGGLPLVADDYVALGEEAKGAWSAHGIYRWAKIGPEALELLGHAAPEPADSEDPKRRVPIPEATAATRLRAVVVPRRAERTGEPVPLSPAQALRALAPSTLMQAPGRDPAGPRALGRLVRALPAYTLEVGPDVERISSAVAAAAAIPAAA